MEPLQARIAYAFADPDLLRQVFTHRSYRHENPDDPQVDNERLEFLGDAVLGFIVSRMLFEGYPDKAEGDLSRLRAQLVSSQHLARKARALGLGAEVRLGRGEELSGGGDKESILADAYESLVAGLLLDGGLEAAVSFVERDYASDIVEVRSSWPRRDYKSRLQEELHASGRPEPCYRVVREAGPDHRKVFEVVVEIGADEVARGIGSSKKSAQQQAARDALARLASG